MPACAVFSCKNKSKTSSLQKDGITFHFFPKDNTFRNKWVVACNRHVTWASTRTSSTICSLHFESSQFQNLSNNRRRLVSHAVPTLFLNNPVTELGPKENIAVHRTHTSQNIAIQKSNPQDVSTNEAVSSTESARNGSQVLTPSKIKSMRCTDASHASSSQQSKPSTSQHFSAATRRTSSPATDDDDDPGDAELFGDYSDDGSMNSIETSTKTETLPKTKMTTKTKATKSKPTTETKTTIALPAADISGDEGFSCNVCSGSIVGFRYTCVQCVRYDLCASCEARGEHSLHYVLRIPKLAKKAEVAAMLSKIRTHLLYGLETEEAEQETDDRLVPALPAEFEIKAEIKEELPDPLELEDAFQPDDDHYTEPECIERQSTSKEKTLAPDPVNTSPMIVAETETEGNYVMIENPVKVTKTEPKTTKHKTTEPEHDGSQKRMKMYLEEQTRAIEALMDTSEDTAGPPTEGASGELPVIVKTEEKDEGVFQVFSHRPHNILQDKPGPDTGMTKSKAKSTSKKKAV